MSTVEERLAALEKFQSATQASVSGIQANASTIQADVSKIQGDEAEYKKELNTFYLMWAGTPLPRLCLRDVHRVSC